jgi:GT2 family glycosyltransferase
MQPKVSIIVLNWNGEKYLENCVNSLLKTSYPNIEIIIVDNASTDGSQKIVEKFAHVRLIQNEKNYGYAGGNNIGFKHASGKYVVALNNDMYVEPDWLDAPIDYMEKDDTIGIAGCRQMRFDKKTIDGLFRIYRKDLTTDALGAEENYSGDYTTYKAGFVIGVNGGSAIYRKKAIDEINGFDEHFFGYFEDVDICLRAVIYGWRILYVPSSVVYHIGGASFRKDNRKMLYLLERNRIWFIYKNYPVSELLKHSIHLIFYEIRHIYATFFKQRDPKFYFETRLDALNGLKLFSQNRKENVKSFGNVKRVYKLLIKQKIIAVDE